MRNLLKGSLNSRMILISSGSQLREPGVGAPVKKRISDGILLVKLANYDMSGFSDMRIVLMHAGAEV